MYIDSGNVIIEKMIFEIESQFLRVKQENIFFYGRCALFNRMDIEC